MIYSITCKNCKRNFDTPRGKAIFCSNDCKLEFARNGRKRICANVNCSKEFLAVHTYNRYCSNECFNVGRLSGKIYTCHCGKEFYSKKPRKYCSTRCFGSSLVVEKVECTCKMCGKEFYEYQNDIDKYNRGIFCSMDCRGRYYSGEKHMYWKGGISPLHEKLRKAKGSRPWRNAVLRRDGYKCVICGEQRVHLQVDHIYTWSLFPELRLTIENGRTLCEDCHIQTATYGNSKYTREDFVMEGKLYDYVMDALYSIGIAKPLL